MPTSSSISTNELFSFLKYLQTHLKRHSVDELLQKYIKTTPHKKLFYLKGLDHIHNGGSLSGFIQQEKGLPPYLSGILQAAEESGDLAGGLKQILDFHRHAKTIRSKIFSASLYPAIILLISFFIFLFFVLWFVPVMAENFSELNVVLSTNMQILLNLNYFLKNHYSALLLSCGFIGGTLWISRKNIQHGTPDLLSKLPLFNHIIYAWERYQFYIGLKYTYARKKELISALIGVKSALSTPVFKSELNKLILQLNEGKSLTAALPGTLFYKAPIHQIIQMNEENGMLTESLEEIEDYLNNRYNKGYELISKLIEPALILIVGLMVLFFIIVFMEPLNSLITKMNF